MAFATAGHIYKVTQASPTLVLRMYKDAFTHIKETFGDATSTSVAVVCRDTISDYFGATLQPNALRRAANAYHIPENGYINVAVRIPVEVLLELRRVAMERGIPASKLAFAILAKKLAVPAKSFLKPKAIHLPAGRRPKVHTCPHCGHLFRCDGQPILTPDPTWKRNPKQEIPSDLS